MGAQAVVFLSLGGEWGRSGKLQSFLACQGIPFTGPGFVSTLLCSDKARRHLRTSFPWSTASAAMHLVAVKHALTVLQAPGVGWAMRRRTPHQLSPTLLQSWLGWAGQPTKTPCHWRAQACAGWPSAVRLSGAGGGGGRGGDPGARDSAGNAPHPGLDSCKMVQEVVCAELARLELTNPASARAGLA